MASVSIVACDGCGKETRDRHGWIHVSARSAAFTQMQIGMAGGAYPGSAAAVIVTRAGGGSPSQLDFCSPPCAGAALFGVRINPDATAPVALPTAAGGLT